MPDTRLKTRLIARLGMTLALVSAVTAFAQIQPNGVKVFTNSVIPLPPRGSETTFNLNDEAKKRVLAVHFSLQTRNQGEKEARVLKGELISASEMKEKYSGSEADVKSLVTWLKSQNFKILRTTPDFADVYAEASVAQIERSLAVKMVPVNSNGITTPNAATPPQLPAAVGEHVTAILGLQPFVQAVKHSVLSPAATKGQRAGTPSKPSTANLTPFKVHDILMAYNADKLEATGNGQLVAVLIDTWPCKTDLSTFWEQNQLSVKPSQVQLINVQGTGTPLLPPQGEETLDAEWASGIAPGATIRVYATGSLQYLYIDEALDQIYQDAQDQPGLRQVSISMGLREDLVSAGEIAAEHAKFLNLAGIGVSVFVSSGDAGSNPDRTGKHRSPDSQVEYEASDPFTVAVGGTSLHLDPRTKAILSEVAWSNSGGGISTIFDRPTWQDRYKNFLVSKRGVPDVSSVADPRPGAFVWLNGKESSYGGTSWSAPVWASFCALLADGRARTGKQKLGFIAPLLYELASGGATFRDITVGNNGTYKAGKGWNAVTGLGVPDLKAIFDALP